MAYSKPFIREGFARKLAREYIARLLLDEAEHVQAFDDETITDQERQEAMAEIRRIGASLIPKHNAEL
ncbi:hypothetical protein [Halopseudomonas aestusnigri]|uniref:hypothetical protein n=1 Tax=Halopseudomonas aestusnigri TaxID=857252 RepID=UPI0030018EC9